MKGRGRKGRGKGGEGRKREGGEGGREGYSPNENPGRSMSVMGSSVPSAVWTSRC